ncbi:MAG TPA: hypothetical protein DD435_11005 [Cyanobacteria bacterium UBA8530]|nr:hypothetical protein [Cyanobacteria bacterium UBA8530]
MTKNNEKQESSILASQPTLNGDILSQERFRPRLLSRIIALSAMILMTPAFLLASLLLVTILFTVPAITLFCLLGVYWNTFFHHLFSGTEIAYRLRCGRCGKEFHYRKPHRLRRFHCLCPASFVTNRIDRKRPSQATASLTTPRSTDL